MNSKTLRALSSMVIGSLLCASAAVAFFFLTVSFNPRDKEIPREELPAFEEAFYRVKTFDASTFAEFKDKLDKTWSAAPKNSAPALGPKSLSRGLDTLASEDKKLVFVKALLPHILGVNRAITAQRAMLEKIQAKISLGRGLWKEESDFLEKMAVSYDLTALSSEVLGVRPGLLIDELLLRADVVPVSLMLAQAAIESAWGCSTAAVEKNNVFGRMSQVYVPSKNSFCMVTDGYKDLAGSVDAYYLKINTLKAYETMRAIRRKLRHGQKEITAYALAPGLMSYSARGQDYLDDVLGMLERNGFGAYDSFELASSAPADLACNVGGF